MTDSTSKKATSFFKTNSRELDLILVKLKELDELHSRVIRYLDPALQAYCQVANLVKGQLILLVANGSIATQLRFQAPDLLLRFKQDPLLPKILEIRCKVRPTVSHKPLLKPSLPMALLSHETAKIIHEIADSLTDSKLREVMNKIAQHVKK